jgi:hypothetical protein
VFAAIIGFVGVVVGALLAASQSAWLERRRDVRETTSAERLIAAALGTAKRQLDTTSDTGCWWPTSLPLPLKAWSDQASKISPDMPEEDLDKLGTAFDVMEKLDALAASRRSESNDTPNLTKDDIAVLNKHLDNVKAARNVLDTRQSARNHRRHRASIFIAATISIIVVAIVGLGAYSAVQFASAPPSVTASSLASSIQTATNVNFASCTQRRRSTADWTCTVADFSGPKCNRSLDSVAGPPVLSAKFASATDCSVTGEGAAEVEVNSKSCWILEYLKRIPSSSDDDPLAAGQPQQISQSPTASGCISK